MLNLFYYYLEIIDNSLWFILGISIIFILGSYFSIKFKFGQITKFKYISKKFYLSTINKKLSKNGIHPLKAFFASIGGCIGIGNIIAVCTAVQIGGPGALFWIWIAAFLGMTLKYSEVYLGLKYRVLTNQNKYDGGPMFYLKHAFHSNFLPYCSAILLAIYGTEIYIFNTMTNIIILNFNIPKITAIIFIIFSILIIGIGGVNRVGTICSAIIPIFLVIFMFMSSYIILSNISSIPHLLYTIFYSAFYGHAPIGGFVGSTLMLTLSQGISRGCYTGDIGIGFSSVIHSESSTKNPSEQAGLAIFGIFLDTFIVCTMSLFVVLITDNWTKSIPTNQLIQKTLEEYFLCTKYFAPLFLIILGYSSMVSFFCVGLKSFKFLFFKHGALFYSIYVVIAFIFFSFIQTQIALSIMSTCGILLLIINSIGIFKLRKKIKFINNKN